MIGSGLPGNAIFDELPRTAGARNPLVRLV